MHEVPAYVHLGCHNSTFTFLQLVLVGEDALEVIQRREEGREVEGPGRSDGREGSGDEGAMEGREEGGGILKGGGRAGRHDYLCGKVLSF